MDDRSLGMSQNEWDTANRAARGRGARQVACTRHSKGERREGVARKVKHFSNWDCEIAWFNFGVSRLSSLPSGSSGPLCFSLRSPRAWPTLSGNSRLRRFARTGLFGRLVPEARRSPLRVAELLRESTKGNLRRGRISLLPDSGALRCPRKTRGGAAAPESFAGPRMARMTRMTRMTRMGSVRTFPAFV